MNNIEAPCKGCKDRSMGCHSTCEKYLEYDKLNDERRNEMREKAMINMTLHGYRAEKVHGVSMSKYRKDK